MNIELLRARLNYDQETGVFTWKSHREARYVGAQAGCINPVHKYLDITINRTRLRAARVAWAMSGNLLPDGHEIDHVNGVKLDNRLCNLRLSTRQQNAANRGQFKNNTTGYKGVSLHKGKYQASIRVHDRLLYLGRYPTAELAHEAYKAAAVKHFAEFANMG